MKIYSKSTISINSKYYQTTNVIGSNILESLNELNVIKKSNSTAFLLLVDKAVYKIYGDKIKTSLSKLKIPLFSYILNSAEKFKSFNTVNNILSYFFQYQFDRNSLLVVVGGGITIDIGGFISSIILRGIRSCYIPTTLLAQIDAAIGGKTGVDFWFDKKTAYKNMIGTFHLPLAVISDITTLQTLPDKEIKNGLGEMVKYWIGWNKPSVKQLSICKNLKMASADEIFEIIKICQDLKQNIISSDFYDTLGTRQLLNLGHTIGHAIEGSSGGQLNHGECVAVGLAAIARISTDLNLLTDIKFKQIITTLKSLDLPVKVKNIDKSKILKLLLKDKKGGKFVLIKDIGSLESDFIVKSQIIESALDEINL